MASPATRMNGSQIRNSFTLIQKPLRTSWNDARASFHEVLKGFWINVKLFLICEPFILVAGLAIALARNARSPWLAPLRVVAVVYTDVVRGIPTLLLVVLFGYG